MSAKNLFFLTRSVERAAMIPSFMASTAMKKAAINPLPTYMNIQNRGLKNLRKRRVWTKAEVEECIYQIINIVTEIEPANLKYSGNFATDLKFSESQVRKIHEAAHIAFDSSVRVVPGLKSYDRFCFSPQELADVMAAELDQDLRLS